MERIGLSSSSYFSFKFLSVLFIDMRVCVYIYICNDQCISSSLRVVCGASWEIFGLSKHTKTVWTKPRTIHLGIQKAVRTRKWR